MVSWLKSWRRGSSGTAVTPRYVLEYELYFLYLYRYTAVRRAQSLLNLVFFMIYHIYSLFPGRWTAAEHSCIRTWGSRFEDLDSRSPWSRIGQPGETLARPISLIPVLTAAICHSGLLPVFCDPPTTPFWKIFGFMSSRSLPCPRG